MPDAPTTRRRRFWYTLRSITYHRDSGCHHLTAAAAAGRVHEFRTADPGAGAPIPAEQSPTKHALRSCGWCGV